MRTLVLASALTLPGIAWAQALPLPEDVAAFYTATPHDDEFLARSADGCGWFLNKPDAPNSPAAADTIRRMTDTRAEQVWDGPCHEGLALGPGNLIWRKDGKTTAITLGWALRGRMIGFITNSLWIYSDGEPRYTFSVAWKGTSYTRTKLQLAPGEAPRNTTQQGSIFVGYRSPNVLDTLQYSFRSTGGPEAQILLYKTTEAYLRTGNSSDRLTTSPCSTTCGALWIEKTGPLIQAFSAFHAAHKPEIDAVKTSVDPVVAPLLRQLAEKERLEVAAAAKTRREANLRRANQAGQLVESRSLDALLKKALGDRR